MDQLKKECAYWQKMLRLQDWKIKLNYLHLRDMVTDPKVVLGRIRANYDWRTGDVDLLHPSDYPSTDSDTNVETTLVHELSHLYTIPLFHGKGTAYERGLREREEQATNAFADALVAVRYGLAGPGEWGHSNGN